MDLDDLALRVATPPACARNAVYDSRANLSDSGCVDLSDLAALLADYGFGR